MTKEEIQNQVTTTPFQPFVLVLSNGAKADLPHPDFISISPGAESETVLVWLASGGWRLIDAHHVVSVESAPAKKK